MRTIHHFNHTSNFMRPSRALFMAGEQFTPSEAQASDDDDEIIILDDEGQPERISDGEDFEIIMTDNAKDEAGALLEQAESIGDQDIDKKIARIHRRLREMQDYQLQNLYTNLEILPVEKRATFIRDVLRKELGMSFNDELGAQHALQMALGRPPRPSFNQNDINQLIELAGDVEHYGDELVIEDEDDSSEQQGFWGGVKERFGNVGRKMNRRYQAERKSYLKNNIDADLLALGIEAMDRFLTGLSYQEAADLGQRLFKAPYSKQPQVLYAAIGHPIEDGDIPNRRLVELLQFTINQRVGASLSPDNKFGRLTKQQFDQYNQIIQQRRNVA